MSSYLITGANRGVGLELVKQLSAFPATKISVIFAAIRADVPAPLQDLIDGSRGRIVPVQVQITDRSSIAKAVEIVQHKLSGKGLDVLINNAGIMPLTLDGVENMKESDLKDAFEINVVAVHNMISGFLPLLRKGQEKKVVTITTTVGSTAYAPAFKNAPTPAYKITKAAVNSLFVNYAQALNGEGFTVFGISPGWLKTDMGSEHADLEPEVGVKAVLDIVVDAGRESNGRFRNILVPGWETNDNGVNVYDGKDPPW